MGKISTYLSDQFELWSGAVRQGVVGRAQAGQGLVW